MLAPLPECDPRLVEYQGYAKNAYHWLISWHTSGVRKNLHLQYLSATVLPASSLQHLEES